jgi:hypothetical protein
MFSALFGNDKQSYTLMFIINGGVGGEVGMRLLLDFKKSILL